MRKSIMISLSVFLILTAKPFAAKSHTTDTLCFPIPVNQKLLIDAKQKKVPQERLQLKDSDILLLSQRISVLREKDSINRLIISNFTETDSLRTRQQANILDALAVLNKDLRMERRKKKATGIFGIIGIAAAFYLGLKL